MTWPLATSAEIAAYNAGVEAVLAIARRTSTSIASSSRRHNHEEFAVAALAEAGKALMLVGPARRVV